MTAWENLVESGWPIDLLDDGHDAGFADKPVESENAKESQKYNIGAKGTLSNVISIFRRADFSQFPFFQCLLPSITHG